MNDRRYPLGLFDAFGIEIEYMIVDRETLDVRPISDQVLGEVSTPGECEVAFDRLAWSNELVLHVIELKTNGPAADLSTLADAFHADVIRINSILEKHDAMLMPTAMHPWMDPETETRLWPHESGEIYAAFNRVFDCRGHGWSNLQSVHINFPFGDDEEFGRLHAAIRMVLPILPAIAASSPIADGAVSGLMDTRLEYYRNNCRRIPSATGHVVPERVFSIADYEEHLLGRLYADIAPLDPEGILQHEWLNARGAIARFDRGAIEIRLLDVQESPRADMAVVEGVIRVVRALAAGELSPYERQRSWAEQDLETILLDTIRRGPRAVIADPRYLRDMGMGGEGTRVLAGDLWKHLITGTAAAGETRDILDNIGEKGCLAERILRAVGGANPRREDIALTYRKLAGCLESNRMFG